MNLFKFQFLEFFNNIGTQRQYFQIPNNIIISLKEFLMIIETYVSQMIVYLVSLYLVHTII